VVSNGLVLDKTVQNVKRLGNAADPFATIEQYGADAARWYMISNASPWDNLKFNEEGLDEVAVVFWYAVNSYSFFVLYANIDKSSIASRNSNCQRPEIDRWIISLLTPERDVDGFYAIMSLQKLLVLSRIC